MQDRSDDIKVVHYMSPCKYSAIKEKLHVVGVKLR